MLQLLEAASLVLWDCAEDFMDNLLDVLCWAECRNSLGEGRRGSCWAFELLCWCLIIYLGWEGSSCYLQSVQQISKLCLTATDVFPVACAEFLSTFSLGRSDMTSGTVIEPAQLVWGPRMYLTCLSKVTQQCSPLPALQVHSGWWVTTSGYVTVHPVSRILHVLIWRGALCDTNLLRAGN